MPGLPTEKPKTYLVEHLDPELEAWSALEYATIARETHAAGSAFILSGVPPTTPIPPELAAAPGFTLEHRGVEELYPGTGDDGRPGRAKVCLLDPAAARELGPEDAEQFDAFLFGGILGDDPPRDRTGELRAKGFEGRRLGPVQMTTDTAVRVTRLVVEGQTALADIPFVDHPELRLSKHESTQMPFRYVKGADGGPVMPEGMLELIRQDAEKGFGDLI